MFAIIRTRWQTRPLSPRAKRRSSAAPGSLRKKYAGIAYPPNMVRLPNHSTTSGDPRKPVLGQGVEIKDDKFEPRIIFWGIPSQHSPPLLGVIGTNQAKLRSWLDKKRGAVDHQFYIGAFYQE